jgi:hypothetical protein
VSFPKAGIAVALPAAVAAAVLAVSACTPSQLGIPTARATGTASAAAHHHRPSASPSGSAPATPPPSPTGTFPAGLTAREKTLIIKVRDHLRSLGYTSGLSNAEVGSLGHLVCIARRNGVTQSQVAEGGRLASAQTLFRMSPAVFARDAEQAICPAQLPLGAP